MLRAASVKQVAAAGGIRVKSGVTSRHPQVGRCRGRPGQGGSGSAHPSPTRPPKLVLPWSPEGWSNGWVLHSCLSQAQGGTATAATGFRRSVTGRGSSRTTQSLALATIWDPCPGEGIGAAAVGQRSERVHDQGRNPARVTVTSLWTAGSDGRLLAAVRACRQ